MYLLYKNHFNDENSRSSDLIMDVSIVKLDFLDDRRGVENMPEMVGAVFVLAGTVSEHRAFQPLGNISIDIAQSNTLGVLFHRAEEASDVFGVRRLVIRESKRSEKREETLQNFHFEIY